MCGLPTLADIFSLHRIVSDRHSIIMLSPLERLPADILIGVTDILGGDKASWDALRCSSRCLREGIGRRITSAVLTTSRPSLSCFPRHSIMKRLIIRGDGPLVGMSSSAGAAKDESEPFGSEAELVAALHAAGNGAEGSGTVGSETTASAAPCNLRAGWASSVATIDVHVRVCTVIFDPYHKLIHSSSRRLVGVIPLTSISNTRTGRMQIP